MIQRKTCAHCAGGCFLVEEGMMSNDFMAKPCAHCPFRTDVRPFLHPERAEEIAYSALNRWAEFPCHKTLDYDDEGDDLVATNKSLTCAGFLTMQINEGVVECPDGFEESENVYSDCGEMVDAYAEEWNKRRHP